MSDKQSLFDLMRQYVRDASPGGVLNPEVTSQGVLDATAMATMPVPVVGDLAGLLADANRMRDPSERTPTNAALMALGVLPFVPSLGVLRGLRRGKMEPVSEAVQASKSPNIYDPKPLPQRPFEHDYQGWTGGSNGGGRIAADIEGRPLAARYVAGRRMVGQADEAIDRSGVDDIGRLLGADAQRVPRSGSELKGDVGRYINRGGGNKSIYVDQSLAPDKAARVQAHELSHAIDDMVQMPAGAAGSKIPTDGLGKELRTIYEDLNSGANFRPGRGATPKTFGYGLGETDAELMAEAIRAYMRDPNYMKTVAPKTAARIREYVNVNPNLRDTIQFNAMAPLTGVGLGTGSLTGLLDRYQDGEAK